MEHGKHHGQCFGSTKLIPCFWCCMLVNFHWPLQMYPTVLLCGGGGESELRAS